MTAAVDLYRGVVLEHGKRPRNRGPLPSATHAADGDNPLCGDAMRVEVACRDALLTAIGFTGESCVVATASASLMTERLTGATQTEAARLIGVVRALCAGGVDAIGEARMLLGELEAFADVHRHPVRVGCATLPWRTLERALAIESAPGFV
jgi:nitrogen fixation NifU-like protein